MATPMIVELFKQLFGGPETNLFPAKYAPDSVLEFLESVKKGETKIIPPIETPPGFRGKIAYDSEKCIGCRQCIRVCPAGAIEFLPEEKKVKIYVARCTFCSQCNDICPVKCLSMSPEFLLADYNKYSDSLIVK